MDREFDCHLSKDICGGVAYKKMDLIFLGRGGTDDRKREIALHGLYSLLCISLARVRD